MRRNNVLERIYRQLYSSFGPQHWWPGDTPLEVIVGSILTQNTAWTNVEKAIANLKAAGALDSVAAMRKIPRRKLASLIRPAGYYNVKAVRLRNCMEHIASLIADCDAPTSAALATPWMRGRSGTLGFPPAQKAMTSSRRQICVANLAAGKPRSGLGRSLSLAANVSPAREPGPLAASTPLATPHPLGCEARPCEPSHLDTATMRAGLLAVNGIGPETADSILLYAFNRPVFVVDAYTRRIFSRHGILDGAEDYHVIQRFFMDRLPRETQLFNEYHALIVRLAKEYCRTVPRCKKCPLKNKTFYRARPENA